MEKKTQLIVTGGTLASSKNADGLLAPSSTALNKLFQNAGFNTSTSVMPYHHDGDPYVIDSIDFDKSVHYPQLRDTVVKSLEQGNTPVICGGTDTLIWYSTLLTMDLKRMGFLKPDSGEKVLFLSSMISLEQPDHVQKILKAGKKLAGENISGGFALCAEDESADNFAVHDVLNQFDKVSSSIVNAFRSKVPIGYMLNGTFTKTSTYVPPPEPKPEEITKEPHYARIAPPLLYGSNSEMILRYMKTIGEAKPPFDGIIIEGFPSKRGGMRTGRLSDNDIPNLQRSVKWLTRHGVRVVFCDHIRFDEGEQNMHGILPAPMRDAKTGEEIKGLIQRNLEEAGAEFVTAMSKETYLNMTLNTPKRDVAAAKIAQDRAGTGLEDDKFSSETMPSTGREKGKLKALGVRYVPDSEIMAQSIDVLAPQVKELGFSALPHNVLPNVLAQPLIRNSKTKFGVTFEYAGNTYLTQAGEVKEGAEANPYAAGEHTRPFLKPYSHSALVGEMYQGR